MLQTEDEIEGFFYTIIKDSQLPFLVDGDVYRFGMRPSNPTTEDIVVHCLEADAELLQRGLVIVNIYVADIPLADGRYVSDKTRLGDIQSVVMDFVNTFPCTDGYTIEFDKMPYNQQVEAIKQTCVVARLAFDRMAN